MTAIRKFVKQREVEPRNNPFEPYSHSAARPLCDNSTAVSSPPSEDSSSSLSICCAGGRDEAAGRIKDCDRTTTRPKWKLENPGEAGATPWRPTPEEILELFDSSKLPSNLKADRFRPELIGDP